MAFIQSTVPFKVKHKNLFWEVAPPPPPIMKVRKPEAVDGFGQTRRQLIALGRQVAWRMTEEPGSTITTQDLRRVMIAEGLYQPSEALKELWLGFVFRQKCWKWTGKWAQHATPSTATRTHSWRTVKVWTRA